MFSFWFLEIIWLFLVGSESVIVDKKIRQMNVRTISTSSELLVNTLLKTSFLQDIRLKSSWIGSILRHKQNYILNPCIFDVCASCYQNNNEGETTGQNIGKEWALFLLISNNSTILSVIISNCFMFTFNNNDWTKKRKARFETLVIVLIKILSEFLKFSLFSQFYKICLNLFHFLKNLENSRNLKKMKKDF